MEEVCFCCGNAVGRALLVYSAGSRIHIEWGLENQSGKAHVTTVEAGPLRRAGAFRETLFGVGSHGQVRGLGQLGASSTVWGWGDLPELSDSWGAPARDTAGIQCSRTCPSVATGLTSAACLRSTASSLSSSQTASGSPLMAMTFSWSLSASILL